jgi:hypothetical protein
MGRGCGYLRHPAETETSCNALCAKHDSCAQTLCYHVSPSTQGIGAQVCQHCVHSDTTCHASLWRHRMRFSGMAQGTVHARAYRTSLVVIMFAAIAAPLIVAVVASGFSLSCLRAPACTVLRAYPIPTPLILPPSSCTFRRHRKHSEGRLPPSGPRQKSATI